MAFSKAGLVEWLTTGVVTHDQSHVRSLPLLKLPADEERVGRDFWKTFPCEQGHPGRLRRGLHGHVQRDHPG